MSAPPNLSDRDQELLSAYLDGALSDRDQKALENRLARDAALRAALDDLRLTIAVLHNAPRLKAPRNFTLDPAIFKRRAPWWQRIASMDVILQLSGALGAAASIVLIILALTLNSGDTNEQSAREVAAVPRETQTAIAILNAMPTSLGPVIEEKQTESAEIAYAGGAQFDTTLAAQSAYIASLTVTSTPAALGGAFAPSPTLAGTPSPAMQDADQVQDAAAMGDEVPPAALAAPPMETAGQAGEDDGMATFDLQPDQASGIAQSESESAPQPGAAPGFREPPESAEGSATQAASPSPMPSSTTTPTREPATATLLPTSTVPPAQPTEAGQRIADDAGAADEDDGQDLLGLVLAGAALLVVSVGLFVLGRRKARAA